MNPYLNVSGLDAATCAGLLGYSPRLFQEWAAGQQLIPPSIASHIASVLGVDANDLMAPPKQPVSVDEIEPAIWFKLRSENLGPADKELVFLVRQLGTFYEELERVRSQGGASGWQLAFLQVRQQINTQAPPREQGREAAQVLRSRMGWNTGRTGIGEIIRGSLRNLGILIVESPIRASKIEGCAFHVGDSQRPCIFVNNHGTTWFRRNAVILHELAHLIFDLPSEGASLDVYNHSPENEISELRAEAFAQEAAAPKEVLAHVAQKHGISWTAPFKVDDLATLVADTHVEPRLIVRAAIESGLLASTQKDVLLGLQIWDRLKQLSEHALSTKEYLEFVGQEESEPWNLRRNTTIPSRTLRLPVTYVKNVLEACEEGIISISRAARLLMIDEHVFLERFKMDHLLGAE